MVQNIYVFFLFFLAFCGCGNKEVGVKVNTENLKREIDIANIFSEVQLIPVSLPEEVVYSFGYSYRLKISNEIFYFGDPEQSLAVLGVNKKGETVNYFKKSGEGEGEYSYFYDFEIDYENNYLILNVNHLELYFYDLMTHEFLFKKHLKYNIGNIYLVKPGLLLCGLESHPDVEVDKFTVMMYNYLTEKQSPLIPARFMASKLLINEGNLYHAESRTFSLPLSEEVYQFDKSFEEVYLLTKYNTVFQKTFQDEGDVNFLFDLLRLSDQPVVLHNTLLIKERLHGFFINNLNDFPYSGFFMRHNLNTNDILLLDWPASFSNLSLRIPIGSVGSQYISYQYMNLSIYKDFISEFSLEDNSELLFSHPDAVELPFMIFYSVK